MSLSDIDLDDEACPAGMERFCREARMRWNQAGQLTISMVGAPAME
jgi:hypothetical protein